MLGNTQMTHIALLCAIAYVIYCMTCPKTIKNTGTLEQINSAGRDNEIIDDEMVKAEDDSSIESETPESRGIVSEVEREIKQEQPMPSDQLESDAAVVVQDSRPIVANEPEEVPVLSTDKVNDFLADEADAGADINSAFKRPIPEGTKTNAVNFNKDYLKKYDSKNYLPKEVNDKWFDTDFAQAKTVGDDKLINTEKYVVGVDTVGQSLKNASYDIRGTVANPKYSVSPWMNSTYEPDYNIKPLC